MNTRFLYRGINEFKKGYQPRIMWDCRLLLQCTWGLWSSGMLPNILVTSISWLPVGPIFKGQAECPKTSVTNYQLRLCNIPEE